MDEMLDKVGTTTQENGASTMLNGVPATAIRNELNRILRSRVFVHSHRIRRFLQFVVEECLLGQQHRLKEYLIGLEVFNRLEAFDPRVDSIVRVEARRLRAKLEEFYQTEGRDDELRIELRKGSYVPLFEYRRGGSEAYGHGLPPLRRSSIVIRRISPTNGENPELIADIARRLSHVLINEGYCHVIASDANGAAEAQEGSAPVRADYVLEGVVDQRDGETSVLLQVIHVNDGTYVWSEKGSAANIENIARSMNRALLTAFAQSENMRLQRHRGHTQSFDQYLQGRYLWKLGTPETVRSSTALFTKAVERDASYAAAWAALAESLVVSSVFGFVNPRDASAQIKEAAQKALELNDNLPEAHVAMGAALSLFDRNWEAGERELQLALQADGRDPCVHLAYGLQLACRGIMTGATAEVERALELDPASLAANFVLGWLRSIDRQYDEAIAHHSLVSQLAPDFPLAYLGLGWAHLGKGMFADALAHFTNASNLLKCRTLLAGCMGHCYARMGNRVEATRQLAQLSSQPPTQYTSPVSMAAIAAGLGETERALAYLEQACEASDCSLPLQVLNPEFDSLRNHQRFGVLVAKGGLMAAGV